MRDRSDVNARFDTSPHEADEPIASGLRRPVQATVPWPNPSPRPRYQQAVTSRAAAVRLLLTPIEAAEQLSISRTKIYELMAAGTLRSIHIGRLRRVPVDALRDFVGALDSE